MAESDIQTNDRKLLVSAARQAGKIALEYFTGQNRVWYKSGDSPVSEADKRVDQYLHEHLTASRPEYGWLSEETEDDEARLEKQRVIIVDPIDGTRGFIEGRKEWCISIAVVENGKPVEAVLHCPALERTFTASIGKGLDTQGELPTYRTGTPGIVVTGSKRINKILNDRARDQLKVLDFIPSLAYRLALVASGEIDGAFARGGACEWDLAAADLILMEAGCRITDCKGEPLTYNKEKVRMPALVAARKDSHDKIMELAESFGILH